MPGRTIRDESWFVGSRYQKPEHVRRRTVLRETLAAFADRGDTIRRLAEENLRRCTASAPPEPSGAVRVFAGDWGDVLLEVTRAHGQRFAVLNMANAYSPGGAYVEGTAAQEENLFRRSDCHFAVTDDQLRDDQYLPEMTALLSAQGGRVYLDTARPRTCIRGREERDEPDLGYRWLADDELVSFHELRAAAQDCRRRAFDPAEARRRIEAQLDTLADAGARYAVLSAFGCGAFANPPETVAELYRAALAARRERFALVAFAIYYPGYGPDNHAVFARVLGG